jgi:transcriptional regulator
MYVPKVFEQPSVAVMQQFIGNYPFATLVAVTNAGIEANHLPFLWRDDGSEYGVLVGHLARTNPVWQAFKSEQNVLIIFQGVDAYISPSWYPAKQEHGKVVPTWNYTAVHASGKMRVIEDVKWLLELLNDLTTIHESQFKKPWAVADAPADFIEKLSGAIVGIEIPVSQLIGKWKLNQNQSEQNRKGVVGALETSSQPKERALAEEIKATLKHIP